eukprot:6470738-Amphidinium_carterae.1
MDLMRACSWEAVYPVIRHPGSGKLDTIQGNARVPMLIFEPQPRHAIAILGNEEHVQVVRIGDISVKW